MSAQLQALQHRAPFESDLTRESPALRRLIAKAADPDPFTTPLNELLAMRLEAAREVFAIRRRQIKVLDKRATDTGINAIRTEADIVPLLFSHTTYKTYPTSFVTKGQWGRLLQWFGTLSAMPVDNVNVEGVHDIDEFIDRLWEAGHITLTTSGTSGKVSFLNRSQDDADLYRHWAECHYLWPEPNLKRHDLHYFQLTPKSGPYILMAIWPTLTEIFARPDSIHFLSEDRLSIAYLMRAGEMRQKLADGTATPQEIAEFEAAAKAQGENANASFDLLCEKILAARHEPVFLIAQWSMLWRLMEKARARGIADGEFHPDSIIGSGGGLKGIKLPDDYQDQIKNFFGDPYMPKQYGMSEESVSFPRCEAGNYHTVPWIIPLILDGTGEKLLDRSQGVVEGRFAFLDLSLHARWGGLISGDKVRLDYCERCACGRPGPVVLPGITRYTDLGEEDKIGCAGTIEAYIKGSIEE